MMAANTYLHVSGREEKKNEEENNQFNQVSHIYIHIHHNMSSSVCYHPHSSTHVIAVANVSFTNDGAPLIGASFMPLIRRTTMQHYTLG